MKYDDGYQLYFPTGFHDAYLNKIEIDYNLGNILLYFDSIELEYKEVALRLSVVDSFDLKNIFKDLRESNEISSLEINNGNVMEIVGVKGWILRIKFRTCEWL